MRSVFSRSISAIFSQFAIRLRVPSALTTSGPRWSRRRAEPPTSRVGDDNDDGSPAAGRAGSGVAGWEGAEGCVVLVLLLFSGAAMVGGSGDEDEFVEVEYRRFLDMIGLEDGCDA